MGANFGILCYDTYTKYISKRAMISGTDTHIYGDNTTLLDEKKALLFMLSLTLS